MKQRRTQGGILAFVLVGALLTALVIGGAFAAKRFIAQNQPGNDTVAEAPIKEDDKKSETPTEPNNDLQKALEQQSAAEKKAQEQKAAQDAASRSTEAPASGSAQAPSAPSQPTSGTATTSDNNSRNLPQTGFQGTTSTEQLPETGPADSFLAVSGAALLIGAVVAFVRSRALI